MEDNTVNHSMEIGEDKNAAPLLTEKLPNSKKLTFDDLLVELGEFGPYQRRQFMLVGLPKIFAGMHMLISIFVAGVPPHRCSVPGWENDTYEIQDPLHQMYVNLTIPSLPGHDPVYSKCELYTDPGETNSSTVQCSHWVYDHTTLHSTIVSDFNLVCDKVSYRSHKRMILMFGLLIGSLIFGFLSDVVGRKIIFCISTNVQAISGIANAFAPDFYSFCAFRFLNGMSNAGIFIIAYVIVTETFGPNKRRWVGVVSGFFFSVGLILLAVLSYLLRDWKHLQLACSVPGLLFVLYWWFLEETPRWLIRKGRREQAAIVLKRLAKANKTKFTDEMLDSVSLDTPKNKENFFRIFKTPVLLMRTCIMFLNWVVLNLTYYGLSLNSGNLAGNIHLNVFLSGLSELPGQAVLVLAVTRVGRRPLFSGSMILGGVACICTLLTVLYADASLQWMTVALSTVGKAFISMAFTAAYIVTTEIFPTSIRNSALGACALFARIGAMISPYIADLGEYVEGKLGQAVPLVTFGVSAVIAGALVLLLPETFRRKLPETIQDSIDLGRKKKSDVLELRWDGQSSWSADVESQDDPLCGHKRDSA